MISDDDIDDEFQNVSAGDTIAWDAIYARATMRARHTRHAQLILEFGPAEYKVVDGCDPDALKLRRLGGARIHVILDWA